MARLIPAMLIPLTLGLAACGPDALTLSVDGLPEPAGGDDHLTSEHRFSHVSAAISCEGDGDSRVCLLEIQADDDRSTGEARSLTLQWPTTSGALSFDDVPPTTPPLAYGHTDDVTGEHRTFDWRCSQVDGTASLSDVPAPGEEVQGQFELFARCVDDLGGEVTSDVDLTGTLTVVPTGDDPS